MSDIVLQLKVTLKEIRPPIWRTILIPSNYTFYQLHLAIQSAMGWKNTHCHAFQVRRGTILRHLFTIGTVAGFEGDEGYVDLDEQETLIGEFLRFPKNKVIYEYDFGDSWKHEVLLQKLLPADPTKNYPICIKGKRAGPPEDCGGSEGYQELLEALRDDTHSQHNEMKQWLRQINQEGFDPEFFELPGCL